MPCLVPFESVSGISEDNRRQPSAGMGDSDFNSLEPGAQAADYRVLQEFGAKLFKAATEFPGAIGQRTSLVI